MKKLYSLYEGDTVIMRSVPAIHIREYLNIPVVENGRLYKESENNTRKISYYR